MSIQYRFGVIITSVIPGVKDTKARPAVVLADLGDDDLIVAPITKVGPRSAYDIPVVQWRSAGLQMACYARVNKPLTIQKSDVKVTVGILVNADLVSLKKSLQEFWTAALV